MGFCFVLVGGLEIRCNIFDLLQGVLSRGGCHCPAHAASLQLPLPDPPALLKGAAPCWVQNFTFVMVGFYEVPVGPIQYIFSIPLNGGPAFKYTNCNSNTGVFANTFTVCSVISSRKDISKKGSIQCIVGKNRIGTDAGRVVKR